MNNQLESLLKPLPGKVGVYYLDLASGKSFHYNGQESFIAASVIKLPVLVAVYHAIQDGCLGMDDLLTLSSADKVPGCGALTQMHSGLEVSIRDLCNLMITLSDNTATNMLINTLGIEKINAVGQEYGLEKTCLNRLLFDSVAKGQGKENYICPEEIGRLLERIYTGTVISPAVSEEIIITLKAQQLNSKIPHLLPRDIAIAHKTGEDSGTTHDVGIIYAAKPFILCFASNDTDVVSAEAALKTIALLCYSKSLA